MSFECVSPFYAVVYPNRKVKKDGSPGARVECSRTPKFVVDPLTGEALTSYTIPCGKCFNCRLRYSYEWTLRLRMEMECHPQNEAIFLTLTYDDLKIRSDQSLYRHLCTEDGLTLYHPDFQRFINNLRHYLKGVELRYFMCGEYGDLGRPHFHCILFGYDFFRDARIYQQTDDGHIHYTHPLLDRAWNKGIAEFGSVSVESISYVAGYTLKKQGKERLDYGHRKPPYIMMSRNPGIGIRFFEEHIDDFKNTGYVYLGGQKVSIPRSFLDSMSKDHVNKDGVVIKSALLSARDLIAFREEKRNNMESSDRQFWIENPLENSVSKLTKEQFLAGRAEQRYKLQHTLKGGDL